MADDRGIPPGGFVGAAQQTPAGRALLESVATPVRRKRKPRKKTARAKTSTRRRAATARTTRKRVSKKRKPARLVKGSLAAKRHMAKLRRMQKRRK